MGTAQSFQEDWKNLYPQFLIDLYYSSSTHAAIINQTAEIIAGEDLVCEEEDAINLETFVKLKKFLRHANSNESLHQVITIPYNPIFNSTKLSVSIWFNPRSYHYPNIFTNDKMIDGHISNNNDWKILQFKNHVLEKDYSKIYDNIKLDINYDIIKNCEDKKYIVDK